MSNNFANSKQTVSFLAALRAAQEKSEQGKEEKIDNSKKYVQTGVADAPSLKSVAIDAMIQGAGGYIAQVMKWTENKGETRVIKNSPIVNSRAACNDLVRNSIEELAQGHVEGVSLYHRTTGTLTGALKNLTSDHARMIRLVAMEKGGASFAPSIQQLAAVSVSSMIAKRVRFKPMKENCKPLIAGMSSFEFIEPVEFNEKSDAGMAFRDPGNMGTPVRRAAVVSATFNKLTEFMDLFNDRALLQQALKLHHWQRDMLLTMKLKWEMAERSKYLSKHRVYFVWPAHEQLLYSGILERIWKPVCNFTENPDSCFAHTFGYHYGGADALVSWLGSRPEGLHALNSGDDSLFAFVRYATAKCGDKELLVYQDGDELFCWADVEERTAVYEGSPIVVRPRGQVDTIEDSDHVIVRHVSLIAPDEGHYDGTQHAGLWSGPLKTFCNYSLAKNNPSAGPFWQNANAFMVSRWYNSPFIVAGSLIAQLVHHGKTGGGMTSCFNNVIMATNNQNIIAKFDASLASPGTLDYWAKATKNGMKRGEYTVLGGDPNDKDEIVVAGADRYRFKDHGRTYSSITNQELETVFKHAVDEQNKQTGFRTKEDTMKWQHTKEWHKNREVSLPFLGFTVRKHTFMVNEEKHEFNIPIYAHPAKSLASLMYDQKCGAEEALYTSGRRVNEGPGPSAIKMAVCLGVASVNCFDDEVYAVCKKVYDTLRAGGHYPAYIGEETEENLSVDHPIRDKIKRDSREIAFRKKNNPESTVLAEEFPTQQYLQAYYLPKEACAALQKDDQIRPPSSLRSESGDGDDEPVATGRFDLLASLFEDKIEDEKLGEFAAAVPSKLAGLLDMPKPSRQEGKVGDAPKSRKKIEAYLERVAKLKEEAAEKRRRAASERGEHSKRKRGHREALENGDLEAEELANSAAEDEAKAQLEEDYYAEELAEYEEHERKVRAYEDDDRVNWDEMPDLDYDNDTGTMEGPQKLSRRGKLKLKDRRRMKSQN